MKNNHLKFIKWNNCNSSRSIIELLNNELKRKKKQLSDQIWFKDNQKQTKPIRFSLADD